MQEKVSKKQWKKNFKKSLMLSTVELLGDLAPTTASNAKKLVEAIKDANDTAKDIRQRIRKQDMYLTNSAVGRKITQSWEQLKNDIKTGDFATEATEDLYDSDNDFATWGSDSYDTDEQENDLPENTKLGIGIGRAITRGALSNVDAIQNMTNYINSTSVRNSKILSDKMMQGIIYHSNIMQTELAKSNSVLEAINTNLSQLVRFQNDNVSITNRSMLEYMENTTKILSAMEDKMAMPEDKEETRKNRWKRDDPTPYLSNGVMDFSEYFSSVKKNFGKTEVGSYMSLLPMALDMMGDNGGEGPIRILKSITKAGLKKLIPGYVKRGIERFDATLGGGIENLLYRVGDMANDHTKSSFMQMIGTMFGASRNTKTSINLSNYNKGLLGWNGYAQKSLVEVIPGYLARIETGVSKLSNLTKSDISEERRYDYDIGQFRTRKDIEKDFDNRMGTNVTVGTQRIISKLEQIMNETHVDRDKQNEVFDAMNKVFYDRVILNTPNSSESRSKLAEQLNSVLDADQVRDIVMSFERAISSSIADIKRSMETIETDNSGHNIYKILDEEYGSEYSKNNREKRYDILKSQRSTRTGDIPKTEYEFLVEEFGYIGPRGLDIPDAIHECYRQWKWAFTDDAKNRAKMELKREVKKFNVKYEQRQRLSSILPFLNNDTSKRSIVDDASNLLFDVLYGPEYRRRHTNDNNNPPPPSPEPNPIPPRPDDGNGNDDRDDRNNRGPIPPRPDLRSNNRRTRRNSDETPPDNHLPPRPDNFPPSPNPDRMSNSQNRRNSNWSDADLSGYSRFDRRNIINSDTDNNDLFSPVNSNYMRRYNGNSDFKDIDRLLNRRIDTSLIENMSDNDMNKMVNDANSITKRALKSDDVNSLSTEDRLIQTLDRVNASSIQNITAFTGVTKSLIGKNGSLKSLFSKENQKERFSSLTNYLFNEKNGPLRRLPAMYQDFKSNIKYRITGKGYTNSKGEIKGDLEDGEYVNYYLNNNLKAVKENVMKHLYGENYRESDIYKNTLGRFEKRRNENIPEKQQTTVEKIIVDAGNESAEKIKEATEKTTSTIFGKMSDMDDSEKNKEIEFVQKGMNSKWKSLLPKAGAGAAIGLGLGAIASTGKLGLLGNMIFTGGPIAGAIIGGGLSLLGGFEGVKKFMFGEEKDGERQGGLISKSMQKTFKKFLPAIAGGAVLGGLKGFISGGSAIGGPLALTKGGILLNTLLPSGILGGAVLGMGIGILKNSDRFKRALFGKEDVDKDGNITKTGGILTKSWSKMTNLFGGKENLKKFGKRAGTGLGIGAVTGAVLSNMGILGGALSLGGPVGMGLLGLGIGISSMSEKFNRIMFGEQEFDKDGNPTGKKTDGAIGKMTNMFHVHFIRPITDKAINTFEELGAYTREKLFTTIGEAFSPLTYGIKKGFESATDAIVDKFDKVGDGIGNMVKKGVDKLVSKPMEILSKIGTGMFDIFKWSGKRTIDAMALPFHMLAPITGIFASKDKKKYKKDAMNLGLDDLVRGDKGKLEKLKGIYKLSTGGWKDYIADDEENGHSAQDIRHLFGYDLERKSAHKDVKDIKKKDKVYSKSNKLSADIAKELGMNSSVVLNQKQIDKIRKRIKKTGIGDYLDLDGNLETSQDITDFIFRRSDWENRIGKKDTDNLNIDAGNSIKSSTNGVNDRLSEIVNNVSEHGPIIDRMDSILETITGGRYKRTNNNKNGNGAVSDEITDAGNISNEEIRESVSSAINENNRVEREYIDNKTKKANLKRKEDDESREARALGGKSNKSDDDDIEDITDDNIADELQNSSKKRGLISTIFDSFTSGGLFSTMGRIAGIGLIGLIGDKVLFPLINNYVAPFLSENIPKALGWIANKTVSLAGGIWESLTRKISGGGKSYETEEDAKKSGKNYRLMEDGTYYVGGTDEYWNEEKGAYEKGGTGYQTAIGHFAKKSVTTYLKSGTRGLVNLYGSAGRMSGSIIGKIPGGFAGGVIGGKIGSKVGRGVGNIVGLGATALDVGAGVGKTAFKSGDNIIKSIGKGAVGAGSTIMISAKSTLMNWVSNLCKRILDFASNSKLLAFFSKSTNPQKGLKVALEAMTSKLQEAAAKCSDKLAKKLAAKATAASAEAGGRAASGAATGGILTIIFTVYDVATGLFEADKLFNVESDEVDLGMRAISSLLKTLLGLAIGPLIDVALEIAGEITGTDFKCIIATSIYKAIAKFFGLDGSIENLDRHQDEMMLETMIYNYENNTNLSVNNYSELKDPSWYKKVWNKLTGKSDKFKSYDKTAETIMSAGFKIKNGVIYDSKGSQVDLDEVMHIINNGGDATTGNIAGSIYYSSKLANSNYDINGNTTYGIYSKGSSGYGNGEKPPAVGYGFAQGDPKWANFKLGKFSNGKTSTMATGGCGPTALASITGTSPLNVAKMAKSNGMITDGGAKANLMTEGAKKLGLSAKKSDKSYYGDLKEGKPVIMSGVGDRSNSPFTKAGHIVTATGVTRDGGVIVNDPMNGKKSVYSRKTIDKNLTNAWSYSKNKSVGFGNGDSDENMKVSYSQGDIIPSGGLPESLNKALIYTNDDKARNAVKFDKSKNAYIVMNVNDFMDFVKKDYETELLKKNNNSDEADKSLRKNNESYNMGRIENEYILAKENEKGKWSKFLIDENTRRMKDKYRMDNGLWWYPTNDPDWGKLSFNGETLSKKGTDVVGLATALSNLVDKAITPRYVLENMLPRMGRVSTGTTMEWDKIFDKNRGVQNLPELVETYSKVEPLSKDDGAKALNSKIAGSGVMNASSAARNFRNTGFMPKGIESMTSESIYEKYGNTLSSNYMPSLIEGNIKNASNISQNPGLYLMSGKQYSNSPFSIMPQISNNSDTIKNTTNGAARLGMFGANMIDANKDKLPLSSEVTTNTPNGSLILINSGVNDENGNPIGAAIAPSADSKLNALLNTNYEFLTKGLGKNGDIEPLSKRVWKITDSAGNIPISGDRIGSTNSSLEGTLNIDSINNNIGMASKGVSEKSNSGGILDRLSQMLSKLLNIGMTKIESVINGKSYNRILDSNGEYATYTDDEGNTRYRYNNEVTNGTAVTSTQNMNENSDRVNNSPVSNSSGYEKFSSTTSYGGIKINPYLQAIANNATSIEEKIGAYTLAAQNASEGNYSSVAANDAGSYSVGLKQWKDNRAKLMLQGLSERLPDPNDKSTILKYAEKSGSILTSSEATELSNVMKKNQSIVEPYQYEYGVSDTIKNDLPTPLAMFKNNELFNPRSLIVPGAIANTGPGWLSGAKTGSGKYYNWRQAWSQSKFNNKYGESNPAEVEDVTNSLLSTDSAWGNWKTHDNYIKKAGEFAKSLPPSVGFGDGANDDGQSIGYGSGANDVLNVALGEVGTTEQPAGSNKVKYNTEYYGKEVSGDAYPWCVVFPWWVFKHAGASNLFYGGQRVASSTALMNWSKKNNRWVQAGTQDAQPGDIVLFNFDKNSNDAEHTGIVLEDMGNGKIKTIEGNTGSGNDANGGQVQIRERNLSKILGFDRPPYDGNSNSKITTPIGSNSNNTTTMQSIGRNLIEGQNQYQSSSDADSSNSNSMTNQFSSILSKVTDIASNYYESALNGEKYESVNDTLQKNTDEQKTSQTGITTTAGYGIGYDELAQNKKERTEDINVTLDSKGVESKLDILIKVIQDAISESSKHKTEINSQKQDSQKSMSQVIVNAPTNKNTNILPSKKSALREMHNKIAR